MTPIIRLRKLAICLMLAAHVSAPANGAEGVAAATLVDGSLLRSLVRTQNLLGLNDVLAAASKHFPGNILDAQAYDASGLAYIILVMNDNGGMKRLYVDASTGAFMDAQAARARSIWAAHQAASHRSR